MWVILEFLNWTMNTKSYCKRIIGIAMTAIKGVGCRYFEKARMQRIQPNYRWMHCRKRKYKKKFLLSCVHGSIFISSGQNLHHHSKLNNELTFSNVNSKSHEEFERLWRIQSHRGICHFWSLRVLGQHIKTTGRRGRTVGLSKNVAVNIILLYVESEIIKRTQFILKENWNIPCRVCSLTERTFMGIKFNSHIGFLTTISISSFIWRLCKSNWKTRILVVASLKGFIYRTRAL